MTSQVDRPDELGVQKKKKKRNCIATKEPHKKNKISNEEMLQFMKTFERRDHLIIEQLKILPAQISI